MLLRVENLGPVRKAELDLSKDLIVLTGPNNTGKTYLTWAVYGLVPPMDSWHRELVGELEQWLDDLREAEESKRPISDLTLPIDVFERSVGADLLLRLPDDFASSPERFSDTLAEVRFSKADIQRFDRASSWFYLGEHSYSLRFGGGSSAHLVSQKERRVAPFTPEEYRYALRFGLRAALVFGLLEFETAVFPVERLAINLFARELAANRTQLVDKLLEENVEPQALLRRRAGRYPRAIRDALQRALKLRSGEKSKFADLADELERDVLGGKLSKTEFDELEFTPDGQGSSKPLGLHQSASVIKSLASLVWHLRYEARAGQRLIIDEPELNLHPDNQRRVARALAKAVNRGLKVMMSTHSDYVVRELNNLIMLSQDSDDARRLVEEMKIDPLSTIKPDKLGVYLVHGGECHAVPVTETGFEVKTIDEEIHRLNRDAQTIYSRLFVE